MPHARLQMRRVFPTPVSPTTTHLTTWRSWRICSMNIRLSWPIDIGLDTPTEADRLDMAMVSVDKHALQAWKLKYQYTCVCKKEFLCSAVSNHQDHSTHCYACSLADLFNRILSNFSEKHPATLHLTNV